VEPLEPLPQRDDEAIAAAKEKRRLQNITKNRKKAKTRLVQTGAKMGDANTRGGSQLGSGSDDTYTGS